MCVMIEPMESRQLFSAAVGASAFHLTPAATKFVAGAIHVNQQTRTTNSVAKLGWLAASHPGGVNAAHVITRLKMAPA